MDGTYRHIPKDLCTLGLASSLDRCPTKPRDAGESESGFEMVREPVAGVRVRGVPRPELFRPAFDR